MLPAPLPEPRGGEIGSEKHLIAVALLVDRSVYLFLAMLNFGVWLIEFALPNRRRSTLRSLRLDNRRRCSTR